MPNPNLSAPKIHDSLTPNLVKSSKCLLSLLRKPPHPTTHPPLTLEAKPRKSPSVSNSRKPPKKEKTTTTTTTTTGSGNTHPTTDPKNTQQQQQQ
jgi:hypothetical protein